MKEKNKKTLRDGLNGLPEHTPPPANWDRISGGLDRSDRVARAPLADRLPTYAPPTAVWNELNEKLQRAGAATSGPRAVRKAAVRPVVRLAIAAMIILSLATAFYLSGPSDPTVSYAYSREPAPSPVTADWDEEEGSFARVLSEIETRNEPQLNTLGSELGELTAALDEVKAVLVAYGEDPKVVRQLAEIERERSDVYRRIIVEL